jgi:hypothetical protein
MRGFDQTGVSWSRLLESQLPDHKPSDAVKTHESCGGQDWGGMGKSCRCSWCLDQELL